MANVSVKNFGKAGVAVTHQRFGLRSECNKWSSREKNKEAAKRGLQALLQILCSQR